MKTLICLFGLVGLMAGVASAGTVAYTTINSTLSCNGIVGCVQDTPTSITDGGLTLSYSYGDGTGVVTPSIINYGYILSTGTASGANLSGLKLTINVLSTPPGTSGGLPNGSVNGTVSTNSSGAIITFSPNNTTTLFGTLPGVVIAGQFVYQVLNPILGLQAPTVGNPKGQTTIQGDVTSIASIPEPSTLLPILGLGLIGLWRRRRATR